MRRLIALGVAGLVLLVLVVAQLVLPGIAADRLRDQLGRSGTVLSVKVSAFPAIELLWGDADSVVVRLGHYRSGSSDLGESLDRVAGVGTIDASAQELESGALTVHDAVLHKSGSELAGSGIDPGGRPALGRAVPPGRRADRLREGSADSARNGQLVRAERQRRTRPWPTQNGALVVAPDVPFGGIATITLFDDPHVQVQSVSAITVPGGFKVSAVANVR